MWIRRSWLLAVVLVLYPVAARAHSHEADAFGGFSYANGSSLWGFRETYAVELPAKGVKPWSIVGDLGLRGGTHDDRNVQQIVYTGGVRCEFVRSGEAKNIPFAQVLVGGLHNRGDAVRQSEFAVGFSAGYDYAPGGSKQGFGMRVQFDYLHGGGNFPGVTAGVVYRYKKQ